MEYKINVQGKALEIVTYEYKFLVPINTINAITEITNNINDSIELIGYIKERAASYNETIECKMEENSIDNEAENAKFICSPIFIEGLYTMLLSNNFITEQIINCLDAISDFQLFGECDTKCKEELLERILKINNMVKNMLIDNDYSNYEDDSFAYIKR